MVITNLNKYTILIFILLLVVTLIVFYFQYREYKKTQNKFRFYPIIFLLVSFLLLCFPILWIKALKQEITTSLWTNIVFVLDVSKSMNALDINEKNETYSRLEASKNFIIDFVSKNEWNNYSLVVFAWDSQRVLPFTSDSEIFITLLSSVDENNVSKQWTNINEALNSWFKNFNWDENYGALVLISDWSDEENINLNNLKELKDNKNVKLLVVWVWTTSWANIPIWQDPFWQIIYKIYNWEKVITKLNENSLKEIANFFSGEYFNLEKLTQIDNLSSLLINVSKKAMVNMKDNFMDLTRNFVIASFVFFLIYLIFVLKYDKNK